MSQRAIEKAFRAVGLDPIGPGSVSNESGRNLPWIRERFRAVSGVYAILSFEGMQPLYVGESHTNRLAETLLRHFRAWKIDPANDPKARRRGGTTYNRRRVLVMLAETPAADAAAYQDALIDALRPRDNVIVPTTTFEPDTTNEDDVAPF